MADTDSLERIRKALENFPLTHPDVAMCDKADLRSLLAREAALREALAGLLPMVEAWHAQYPRDIGVMEAPAIERARAALASTEPTKEAR